MKRSSNMKRRRPMKTFLKWGDQMKEHYTDCWTYPKEVIDERFHELTYEDVGARPADTKAIDISDKFEYKLSGGTGYIFAWFDPASKTVRGNFSVSGNSDNITTTTAIFKLTDSKYLPPDSYGFNAVMTAGSSTALNPYYGVVNKEGEILQKLGATVKNIYGTFEYIIK